LIGDVTYGAKVTNEWDRRILKAYISVFISEEALEISKFSSTYAYPISDVSEYASIVEYARSLPDNDKPEVIGQVMNGKFSGQLNDSKNIISKLQNFQPRASIEKCAEEKGVRSRIADLLKLLKIDLDSSFEISKLIKPSYQKLITQEIYVYTKVLASVRTSLENLELALSGRITFSENMNSLYSSVLQGLVPKGWREVCLDIGDMLEWVKETISRYEYLLDWATGNEPIQIWLSAFSSPQRFFATVKQDLAKKVDIGIDSLTWEFTLLGDEERLQSSEDSIYIKNVVIAGARYSFLIQFGQEKLMLKRA
jgi:dynein heavy chain